MSILRTKTIPLALLSLATPAFTSGFAQTKDEKSLETVNVEAKSEEPSSEKTKSYTVKKSSSATKLDIPQQETPQTVNTVTRQVMDDFGLSNARQVLGSTPGVSVQNQETDRTSYSSRGSEISNFQTDGLGIPFGDYNYQNGDIDTYIFDRVEVVKGANGLTSSLGDPGATVNFIRKRPTYNTQANGGLYFGSWNTYRVEGDVSGHLTESGNVRGRLIGAAQQGDWYLDNYASKKYIISGLLEFDISNSTTLTVGAYQQSNRPTGNNWGALPLIGRDGAQLKYDREYNPVPDWTKWDKDLLNAFVELKQDIGDHWTLLATINATQGKEDSDLVYYFGAPDADGAGVTVWPALYTTDQDQVMADVNMQGRYPLFGRTHEAVVGITWSKNQEKQKSWDAQSVPTINWYTWDGQFDKPGFAFSGADSSKADTQQEITSIYAATRLHITDEFKTLLGLNQTKAESSGNSYGSNLDYDKSKTIPYAGLTYDIGVDYTAYASYSTIFRPQSQLDTEGKVIDPVEGQAYELGVKSSWLDKRLTGSFAVFDTLQKHYPLRASDSASIIKTYHTGDLATRGFELNLAGKVYAGTNLILGYTQVKMKDERSGQETRTYMPAQVFDLLATYDVLPEFKIGAGLTWQAKTWLDVEGSVYDADGNALPYAGTIRQSGYTLARLMASYDVTRNVSVQGNAENIGNVKYLNSFPDAQGFYGAPANYMLSVQFQN